MGWDWGEFWQALITGGVAIGVYQAGLFLLGYRLHRRRTTILVKVKPSAFRKAE